MSKRTNVVAAYVLAASALGVTAASCAQSPAVDRSRSPGADGGGTGGSTTTNGGTGGASSSTTGSSASSGASSTTSSSTTTSSGAAAPPAAEPAPRGPAKRAPRGRRGRRVHDRDRGDRLSDAGHECVAATCDHRLLRHANATSDDGLHRQRRQALRR